MRENFLSGCVDGPPPDITYIPFSVRDDGWLKYKSVLDAERRYGIIQQ